MNYSPAPRMLSRVNEAIPSTPPPGIGLFDLDGTLIAWDCQLLFRHFVLRREPWRGIFLPVFLAFLPLTPVLGAGGMKRVFLSYLWRMDPDVLAEYSRGFAASVMPAIYPEVRVMLEKHRASGHLTVLASASPEFYVKEIGRELGFDLTLGTVVETGHFFPDLENHKGEAKVKRLHEVLPASYFADGQLRNCHGYTDSTADLPMLTLCGAATTVNPGARLTALAGESGWHVVRPARPWKSPVGKVVRMLALLSGIGKDPGGIGDG